MCSVIVWDVLLTHSSVCYRLPLHQALTLHTTHLLGVHGDTVNGGRSFMYYRLMSSSKSEST